MVFGAEAGESKLLGLRAAADPEQAVEVDADGGSGFGMERVRDVDPGADAACVGEAGDKGKRERGAAGAFRSGEFGDGPNGESAAEGVIECCDARGRGGADDARRGGERGRDAVGEGSFDLLAEGGGGRHTATFALSSPIGRGGGKGDLHSGLKGGQLQERPAQNRLAMKRLAEIRFADGVLFC